MKELRILGPNELGKGILIEMDAGYVSPMDILNESVFKESNMLDYKKPFQITKLFRNSFYNCDFAISNWICDHGFNGYDAKPILRMPSIRNDPKHPNFPEETVLCNPEPNLSHIKSYTLKYTKEYQTNEKILKQLADIQHEVNEL